MPGRDKYQRQTYAMRRASAAVARLILVTTPAEKAQAGKMGAALGEGSQDGRLVRCKEG
ncbi:hypothetical protein AWB78_08485 [Caballeronia calidae]|uniref:Uncharacterized protein n=1 Tax=Caballeronia calidae TaxID=1777139 RepID=A0A158EK52_9BURK|nr:hypothetical protein [Caballeronia calidae]SAL07229.1 hypothetical protein AWB78_08485 [Caballeronia calidae]